MSIQSSEVGTRGFFQSAGGQITLLSVAANNLAERCNSRRVSACMGLRLLTT